MKKKQNYWYDADQIEQIAIRIKKRDESAWLEFMEITKQRYYCIALDVLNHDEELANEALIEAYTKIFKKTDIWKIGQMKEKIEKRLNSIKKIIENSTSSSLDYQLLILRYYILRYQFYHTQSNNKEAFTSAKEGVEWINKYNLYSHDLENCGKIWRF